MFYIYIYKLENINEFIGRKKKLDNIYVKCNNIRRIDSQVGFVQIIWILFKLKMEIVKIALALISTRLQRLKIQLSMDLLIIK